MLNTTPHTNTIINIKQTNSFFFLHLSILDEIIICIPAYNEGRDAFINTIDSIDASNYPKEKLYMFFIVDGNRGNSFQALMSVLNPNWKGFTFH